MRPNLRRFRNVLVCVGLIAGAAAPGFGQSPVGTWDVYVCKGPCGPGTADLVARGIAVLLDTPLPFSALPDSARLFLRPDGTGLANACITFQRLQVDAKTYAGSARVLATRWEQTADGLLLVPLYRSPDAGNQFQGRRLDSVTIKGIGESWGAGVVAVDWPPDSTVFIRHGPPDLSICTDAAIRYYRDRLADSLFHHPFASPPVRDSLLAVIRGLYGTLEPHSRSEADATRQAQTYFADDSAFDSFLRGVYPSISASFRTYRELRRAIVQATARRLSEDRVLLQLSSWADFQTIGGCRGIISSGAIVTFVRLDIGWRIAQYLSGQSPGTMTDSGCVP